MSKIKTFKIKVRYLIYVDGFIINLQQFVFKKNVILLKIYFFMTLKFLLWIAKRLSP